MGKKYTASRISSGNQLFPPSITVEKDGLTIKVPGLFNGKKQFVFYYNIASITYEVPRVGFTKLRLSIGGGGTAVVKGFYKSDCIAIMEAWKNSHYYF